MKPTKLQTTTTTLPRVIRTTTTTQRRLLGRGCTQRIRPSCSRGGQWVSSRTTDPCASHLGWAGAVVWNRMCCASQQRRSRFSVFCCPQIVLLIIFMCITLLLASLVCLTLPGKEWKQTAELTHHFLLLGSTQTITTKSVYIYTHGFMSYQMSRFSTMTTTRLALMWTGLVAVCVFSFHRSLADVLLDRKFQDPRAVHGSVWSLRVLAVGAWNHRPAGLDAAGPHRHHAQSAGVVAHGECQWVLWCSTQVWC